MCGITGFNWRDDNKINELNNLLEHRGPDDAGTYTDDRLSFAQRRLSILDLSDAGHQPMFYTKKNGACSEKHNPKLIQEAKTGIVFNGEIYNFPELKSELQKKGYVFTTQCDTELILAAYLEWGTECVKRFNGMWAFCLYDIAQNQLFLSRDRMGQKPLYYYLHNGKFIFGSELKVFYKSAIKKEVDDDALHYYMLLNTSPSDRTIVKHIRKLLPGHSLIFNLKDKTINTTSYWQIHFAENNDMTAYDARQHIYSLLDDSIRMRLLSDVPVGAFLSGGVDSSTIVYFMRKHISDLKTFSIRFDYKEFNESSWAKIIADKFNTDHYEIDFTAQDVKQLINDLPNYFDEPFGDSSMIPTYLVSKVARRHVTVCLSGTGGDELFAGYPRHHEYLLLKKLARLPRFIKTLLTYGYRLKNSDKANKLNELLNTNDDGYLYIKLFSHLFRGEDTSEYDLEKLYFLTKHFIYNDKVTNLLNFEQNIYLPDDLLVKEDRATMAHSLEGRIPFLDYQLVEFANTIPSKLKLQGKQGKYILKKTFENKLPNEILYRQKQGFGVPLPYYFRNELKDYTYDILFNANIPLQYIKPEVLNHFWNQHQKGISDYSALFWNIIMFNKWYEKWMS